LNVKTFKGLEGKIYCPTHTPVSRSSTSADAVAVKSAQNAPKKKAEGLATAHNVDKKTAKGPAGDIVRSTDSAPAATDQSTSGGGTATRLGDAGAGYAPDPSEEEHHHHGGDDGGDGGDDGGAGQEEEQYEHHQEEEPQEEYGGEEEEQYDE